MAKKKTWKFKIKKSKKTGKNFIGIIAGNGEPFLNGQLLKQKGSTIRALNSMIDAIKEDRFRIIANAPEPKKKK